MSSKHESAYVNIRVICLSPPQSDENGGKVIFGLQDKSQNLLPGQGRPDGSLQFECQLEARKQTDTEQPNWFGAYAHGTPGQRFLYLSLGYREGDGWHWIRRIKVPLSSITWAQIDEVNVNQAVLEATVDGGRSGTVRLVGEGWRGN
jgi:hypothetical protein